MQNRGLNDGQRETEDKRKEISISLLQLTLSSISRAFINEYCRYFPPIASAIYYDVNKPFLHGTSLDIVFNAFILLFLSLIFLFAAPVYVHEP
jgi:hypothetical protein